MTHTKSVIVALFINSYSAIKLLFRTINILLSTVRTIRRLNC
ncbi:Uncharacterised protein [Vibrio cholerae]|nr:Uncharacterised protein [Vibrio cholerae]